MNGEHTRGERCQCGCCHAPDHGACDDFEEGANGRCVYCDHGERCHPGKGEHFNLPLSVGTRETKNELTEQFEKELSRGGIEVESGAIFGANSWPAPRGKAPQLGVAPVLSRG